MYVGKLTWEYPSQLLMLPVYWRLELGARDNKGTDDHSWHPMDAIWPITSNICLHAFFHNLEFTFEVLDSISFPSLYFLCHSLHHSNKKVTNAIGSIQRYRMPGKSSPACICFQIFGDFYHFVPSHYTLAAKNLS